MCLTDLSQFLTPWHRMRIHMLVMASVGRMYSLLTCLGLGQVTCLASVVSEKLAWEAGLPSWTPVTYHGNFPRWLWHLSLRTQNESTFGQSKPRPQPGVLASKQRDSELLLGNPHVNCQPPSIWVHFFFTTEIMLFNKCWLLLSQILTNASIETNNGSAMYLVRQWNRWEVAELHRQRRDGLQERGKEKVSPNWHEPRQFHQGKWET